MGRRDVELAGTTSSAGVETLGPTRQRTWVLVVRAVTAVAIVAGWVWVYQTPAERSVEDLHAALDTGTVTQVTVERPRSSGVVSGSFEVEWEGRGRPGHAYYDYEPGALVDEGAEIIRAAERSGVEVTVTEPLLTGTTWNVSGIGAFVALVLLVGGTAPRLATRWAWFWLWLSVPPAALVYVLVEPVPLWRRGAPPAGRMLTGGWAFLLATVLANTLPQALPLYADLFPQSP